MGNNPRTKIILDTAALLSGLALSQAFAPTDLWPLAIIAPAIFLAILFQSSTNRAFIRSLLFGLGFFSGILWWIFNSVHTYGNVNAPVAILLTALPIMACALIFAIGPTLLIKFFPKNTLSTSLLGFPFFWILSEWLRSFVATGLPWLLLGDSQINSPLKGFAPLFSVYGVSFITLMCSACLFLLTKTSRKIRIAAMALLLSLFTTGWILSKIEWTHPTQPTPVRVSLVQGNIMPSFKWAHNSISTYEHLSQPFLGKSQIIVWPETAINNYAEKLQTPLNALSKKFTENKTALITGTLTFSMKDDMEQDYNSAIVLGQGNGEYNKRHLVPFGEYIPFYQLYQLIAQEIPLPQFPGQGFSKGPKEQKNLIAAGFNLSPFVCYEIIFPELVRDSLQHEDGQFLLTISDDAWFGHSPADEQHLQMAQMRSLETGRDQLFATNNGMTALINAHGEITAQAPRYVQTVLTGAVTPRTGRTPWLMWGLWPFLIFSTLYLCYICTRPKK